LPWVRCTLAPAKGCEVMENLLIGLISITLIVYLLWALIRPEDF
jgi:K+-transporting ATPase KdpF subunit